MTNPTYVFDRAYNDYLWYYANVWMSIVGLTSGIQLYLLTNNDTFHFESIGLNLTMVKVYQDAVFGQANHLLTINGSIPNLI